MDVFDTYSFASLEVAHESFGYKKRLSEAEIVERKKSGRRHRHKKTKEEKAALKMKKYEQNSADVIKEEDHENESDGSDKQ